jgi:hypothetical protein
MGIFVVESYAYISANFLEPDYGELQVIDVSDPTHPAWVASGHIPGGAYGVFITGDYAYVAAFDYGLRIFDVSMPTIPVFAGRYDTPGSAKHVFVSGSYAFVSDWLAGVEAINISDPYVPALTDSFNTTGMSAEAFVAGEYVYVADNASLVILRFNERACHYVLGDVNNDGVANGLDVVYAVIYFKGGSPPPTACDCPPHGVIYAAGDVNGNCVFNGIDVTYFVTYLKGGSALIECPDCPPRR